MKNKRERYKRSLVKSMTYRAFSTITTTLLVFAFTRKLTLSIGVGIFDFFIKSFLYYFHERTWDKIGWGLS